MQETKHTPSILPKESRTALYLAITFAVAIIAMTVGMFFYNTYLSSDIATLESQITEKKQAIDAISRDKNVIISKIESSNTIRPSIDLKGIVNDFYDAATRSNVRLKGFSIANDVISTSLTATEGDAAIHPDAASTIIKMMRTYAEKPQGRFALEPISTISGTPGSRTTGIQFQVVALPIR